MPVFDSRAVAAALVGLLVILAVSVAADAYVQWSYDTAFEEFLTANTSSASDADEPDTKSKSGCPVGKKGLPTTLIPFR
jgi:hypothetical protein